LKIDMETYNYRWIGAVNVMDNKEEEPISFFKEKIIMNTSFAYGILFGLFAERYLVGLERKWEGVVLYFLRQLFS